MKKKLLSIASAAALLGAYAAPAFATSTFHLVVPLSARTQVQQPAEPTITVTLAGAALPGTKVNQAYSESLRSYLSVTGDAGFDPAVARWSLAGGALPAGLALDEATGAIAGKPTAKTATPASFTVMATYKGADGQAVYTIEVDGEVLNVSKIAAGSMHTCAITETGGVKCWGYNGHGQLGDNSTTDRVTPVDVVGLGSGVVSIAAGFNHTCAITATGAAKCWGLNGSGQLGDNSITARRTPVDVVGLGSGVESIAAGQYHSCAVVGGGVKCWGGNGFGQLGDNSTTTRRTPVAVVGLDSGVAGISTVGVSTCAVTTSGAAKCWGANGNGQLGDNSTAQRNSPVTVTGLGAGVSSVAAGVSHTCAVTTSGAAKCWGWNAYGQLGDNSVIQRLTPVDVVGLGAGVASMSANQLHTCAVTTSGAAKCWGLNGAGQLGDNSTGQRNAPVDVVGLGVGVARITTGDNHTCALMTTGSAKCWGSNGSGRLGDGTATNRLTPVDVQSFQ